MRKMTSAFLIIAVFSISTVLVSGQVTPNMFRKVSDFDGDGKADFAVTRNENGNKIWYVWQSRDGFRVLHWGLGGTSDFNAPGDYDGDGKTDFAVFRYGYSNNPVAHQFHVLESGSGAYTTTAITVFDFLAALPAHQDYNGDGRVDPAVFRYGNQFTTGRLTAVYSGTSSVAFESFFFPLHFPIRIGDMDGDGNAEISRSHRETFFTTITNPVTSVTRYESFGRFGDEYQMADFDGDGKGDLTIFRPSDGTWWWIRSSDNVVNVVKWGMNGDRPVPADYDGDGKTDLAIWRPGAQSVFWVLGSQTGVQVFPWGISSDQPVQF